MNRSERGGEITKMTCKEEIRTHEIPFTSAQFPSLNVKVLTHSQDNNSERLLMLDYTRENVNERKCLKEANFKFLIVGKVKFIKRPHVSLSKMRSSRVRYKFP